MLSAAQNGVTSGEPMYAIWAQSKVTGNSPKPDDTPNYSKVSSIRVSNVTNLQDWQ